MNKISNINLDDKLLDMFDELRRYYRENEDENITSNT